MAMSGEILGISPIELSGVPATAPEQARGHARGRPHFDGCRARQPQPSQIITRKSLENTIASVAASGGSTNAVLHLLAIAREMGLKLSIDDFDAISRARRTSARSRRRASTWLRITRRRAARGCWPSA
jgi:dihydroxy-acid dehydratase